MIKEVGKSRMTPPSTVPKFIPKELIDWFWQKEFENLRKSYWLEHFDGKWRVVGVISIPNSEYGKDEVLGRYTQLQVLNFPFGEYYRTVEELINSGEISKLDKGT